MCINIHDICQSLISEVLAIDATSNPHHWKPSLLQETFTAYESLGIFHETQLVAYVIYRSVLDETEIIHIVCDARFHNQGYASQLLSELITRLSDKNINQCFLEVRSDNHSAQKLYKKMDFTVVGRRNNYYANSSDALIMRRSFNCNEH